MKWSHYLIVCAAVAVIVAGAVLFVPGLSQTLEAELIGFLGSNAA